MENHFTDSTIGSEDAQDEILHSWKISPKSLFYFRCSAGIYGILGILYICLMTWPAVPKEYFFLTNWGHTITAAYFIMVSIYYFKYNSSPKQETEGSLLGRIIPFVAQTIFAMEVLILFLFWTILAKDIIPGHLQKPYPRNILSTTLSILLHGVTPLCIILDIVFNMISFQLKKGFVVLFVFCTVYGITNYIGTQVLERPVYKPMTWESFVSVLFMIGMFGFACLNLWLGHLLQQWKARRTVKSTVLTDENASISYCTNNICL